MSNNEHNIENMNFDTFINAVGSEIEEAQVRLIESHSNGCKADSSKRTKNHR